VRLRICAGTLGQPHHPSIHKTQGPPANEEVRPGVDSPAPPRGSGAGANLWRLGWGISAAAETHPRPDLAAAIGIRDSNRLLTFPLMRKSEVTCPECKAGYRRIELVSRVGTKGEFRCLLCDHLLEVFDGSSEVAIRPHRPARKDIRVRPPTEAALLLLLGMKHRLLRLQICDQ